MSEFMLLIYTDQTKIAGVEATDWEAIHGEYVAVTKAMSGAGVTRGGAPLHPAETAKTVASGGVVTDGPFAEVTEVLGGYYLLEVPSMDEAVAWAGKLPGVARGFDRIEVRPVQPWTA